MLLRNAPLGTTSHHYTPHDSLKQGWRAGVCFTRTFVRFVLSLRLGGKIDRSLVKTRLREDSTLPPLRRCAARRAVVLFYEPSFSTATMPSPIFLPLILLSMNFTAQRPPLVPAVIVHLWFAVCVTVTIPLLAQ